MSFNVPEAEKSAFNKETKKALDVLASDVGGTLIKLKSYQPETLVESYGKPLGEPVARDLSPLEQYFYMPQPVAEVEDLTVTPQRESMVVPQDQPRMLSNLVNQYQTVGGRDMVGVTPYEQAVIDASKPENDSLRDESGGIVTSPLDVFSKPLSADKIKALGYVDSDMKPTEKGELFYNLVGAGMFDDDGIITEKGQAYMTPTEDVGKPENLKAFKILWDDEVIRPNASFGEMAAETVGLLKDAAIGGTERIGQEAQSLWHNSQTWSSLFGQTDRRPKELRDKMTASGLGVMEGAVENIAGWAGMADVGAAWIGEKLYDILPAGMEAEAEQAMYSARQRQWQTQQDMANLEAGEIAETVLGFDNMTKTADAAKSSMGAKAFDKQYKRAGAFAQIAADPLNLLPGVVAVKAARTAPLANRLSITAQKRMAQIAAKDLAIAEGRTAVEAANAVLAKESATVAVANRLSSDIASRVGADPSLVMRFNQASTVASRITQSADQIRSTLPKVTSELDSLIAQRNGLATRIPEAYAQKTLQTMEAGRKLRALPAKALGGALERVGNTISKIDDAATNFLQERGLDQMYTAAVGAAGVVGLAGSPIVGAIAGGAAVLKAGKALSNYGKLFRYVGKEMEAVRGQIPFWKRVAAHTAPGSLNRGIAHTFNTFDLGGATSDVLRRVGRGATAAAPADLMFEYLSDGADMRPETLYRAASESLVIGGSFAAAGGAFMGTNRRMRELSIGDELNFRRDITDAKQKALFEEIPSSTRRSISTYAIANPTLNYSFKDSGASRYDPNTNTAVINVRSTNPIKALVAHETLHHTIIKNNMESGISALFLGDIKENTVGGLFRSRDGKLDPNFEAFKNAYYKRLGAEGMTDTERDAIYSLDKVAVEYFIEKHADQYSEMAESGELGAVSGGGAFRRKLGSILETILPRIPVLKDLNFKSGGAIDANGSWVTGNGLLGSEGVKSDPIAAKMFREMNRRGSGLAPGQFDPLMSDKPDSGAPILLDPASGIDAELLHPLVNVDDDGRPITQGGKPVAIDKATELSRALAGLTAVEVLRRKKAENYAPEKGEASVDDNGEFQPGWLSNDVLSEMFAKNKYNPEQKRIIREVNKLIRNGNGDRMVMINFPATTRNRAGKAVYKPQGATLRDTVPVSVAVSKAGNLLFGLMSVTKLHENIQKRSQSKRGKKLYGGNVDLILRDTQAMMQFHKDGIDSIEHFKAKYGAIEATERKNFINTMFGLLNQKEQAVLNPVLLADGVRSKDNVYRTYRADRVSKAVPMSPQDYPAMPFSYEAVSQVKMPEQRQMPEVSPEDLNPITNKQEAQRLFAEGKRLFAVNEMDEKAAEITSVEMLNSYPADAVGWMEPEQAPAPSQTRFMPEGVDEDKFYSQLDRVITDKVPNRATVAQIMATIDPTRGSGVKAEEIKWSGIEQALASLEKDGKVSKEDLLNYLRDEGQVRFEEVTLGGGDLRIEQNASGSFSVFNTSTKEYLDTETTFDTREEAEQAAKEYADNFGGGGKPTKFAQYVLPGGENYREVVLAMPQQQGLPTGHSFDEKINNGNSRWFIKNEEGKSVAVGNSQAEALGDYYTKYPKSASQYTSSHFPDIPNYVAHMRLDERTLGDGTRTLHSAEYQSDRHQEGRKKGYKGDDSVDLSGWRAIETNGRWRVYSPGDPMGRLFRGNSAEEAIRNASGNDSGTVADAPFRTTWPLQLFKRQLRDAVEGGFDSVSWDTGDTQNDRFDLSKSVDKISVPMVNAESRSVRIDEKGGSSFKLMVRNDGTVEGQMSASQFTGKKLDEVIGKDMADKIMAATAPVDFEGNDLKVGGSGMRGFYDNMMPKEIGKYVKQWKGKVEKGVVSSADESFAPQGADTTNIISSDGRVLNTYDQADAETRRNLAQRWLDYNRHIYPDARIEEGSQTSNAPETPIWRVKITPEMLNLSQTGQMRYMPEGYKSHHDETLLNSAWNGKELDLKRPFKAGDSLPSLAMRTKWEEKPLVNKDAFDFTKKARVIFGKNKNGDDVMIKFDPNLLNAPSIVDFADVYMGEQIQYTIADRMSSVDGDMGGPLHPFLKNNDIVIEGPDGRKYVVGWGNNSTTVGTKMRKKAKDGAGVLMVYLMGNDAHQSNTRTVRLFDTQLENSSMPSHMAGIARAYSYIAIKEIKHQSALKEVERINGLIQKARESKKGPDYIDNLKSAKSAAIKESQKIKVSAYDNELSGIFRKVKSSQTRLNNGLGKQSTVDANIKELSDFAMSAKGKRLIGEIPSKFIYDMTKTFDGRKSAVSQISNLRLYDFDGPALSAATADMEAGDKNAVVTAIDLSNDQDFFMLYMGNDPKQMGAMTASEKAAAAKLKQNSNFVIHEAYDTLILSPLDGRRKLNSRMENALDAVPDSFQDVLDDRPSVKAQVGKTNAKGNLILSEDNLLNTVRDQQSVPLIYNPKK